jgi:hypothetical protein
MWKFGGRTRKRLKNKIYSLKKYRMRMRSLRVAQHNENHKMKNCRI